MERRFKPGERFVGKGQTLIMSPVIGFVGMTHLGLVSGVSAAEKGFKTICFDESEKLIVELQRGELPVNEPLLDELLSKNKSDLIFTNKVEDLRKCNVVYIANDIPTDDFGVSNTETQDRLVSLVSNLVTSDVVIVVLSQVSPGYTRSKLREGINLYYQVETLVFGSAVERALRPERYIIGCVDPADPLPQAYDVFLKAYGCPILRMKLESAELAKVSINMCLVSSISVANAMAEICEVTNADWSEIVPALRLDKRIGSYAYIEPGLGISGGNLERDLSTIVRISEKNSTNSQVIQSWITDSRKRKLWAVEKFRSLNFSVGKKAVIALWGLAYKENTNSIKNSPAIKTVETLTNVSFKAYDPIVKLDKDRYSHVDQCNTAIETLYNADVLMILTAWDEFRNVDQSEIALRFKGEAVIDPFRMLDNVQLSLKNCKIFNLGRNMLQ